MPESKARRESESLGPEETPESLDCNRKRAVAEREFMIESEERLYRV